MCEPLQKSLETCKRTSGEQPFHRAFLSHPVVRGVRPSMELYSKPIKPTGVQFPSLVDIQDTKVIRFPSTDYSGNWIARPICPQ